MQNAEYHSKTSNTVLAVTLPQSGTVLSGLTRPTDKHLLVPHIHHRRHAGTASSASHTPSHTFLSHTNTLMLCTADGSTLSHSLLCSARNMYQIRIAADGHYQAHNMQRNSGRPTAWTVEWCTTHTSARPWSGSMNPDLCQVGADSCKRSMCTGC
jgi:hypothetical protein